MQAQSVDTLFYNGGGALKYRYQPYQNSNNESEAIYRICQLDSNSFDLLDFTFQILRDGSLGNIQITGDLSNYISSELSAKLRSVQLFNAAEINRVVYASYRLKGNINKSTHSPVSDLLNAPTLPFSSADIATISEAATQKVNQNFVTTEEKLRTFVSVTFEVGKMIDEVKIIRGTNAHIDQAVVDAVAEEMFDNKRYIYSVHRRTGKEKPVVVIILVTTPGIRQDSLVFPFKLISLPRYRLKKRIQYDGINLRGSDRRKYIDDSTLIKIGEVNYFYNENNQVKLIKGVFTHNDSTYIESDSIVYNSIDSITIFNLVRGGYNGKRIFNYPCYLEELGWRKKMDFYDGINESYSIVKDGRRLVRAEHGTTYNSSFQPTQEKMRYRYNYDDGGRINSIHIKYDDNSDAAYHYEYYQDGYVKTWSSGNWHDSNYFYFDKNGYLIATVSESDTQPMITRYEYEPGWGNASAFENSAFDLITFTPPVH